MQIHTLSSGEQGLVGGTNSTLASAPAKQTLTGAGESAEFVPPGRIRSSEDRARSRAQLRLTFACRRKTNTEEPNSVEKGTHRRMAPAPMWVFFAGADAKAERCLPTRDCSSEYSCNHTPSSGQHSLAGGRIPKSPTPSRSALTGGGHQLLLRLSSPELVRA